MGYSFLKGRVPVHHSTLIIMPPYTIETNRQYIDASWEYTHIHTAITLGEKAPAQTNPITLKDLQRYPSQIKVWHGTCRKGM